MSAPKLTDGGYSLISAMFIPASFNGNRVSITPYKERSYTMDGDHVNAGCVERLVADGYLIPSPPPPHRPMFYDLSPAAKSLCCPACWGQGIVAQELAADGEQQCPQCFGRRILHPGKTQAEPYRVKPPRPRRYRYRKPSRPLGFTRDDMEFLAQRFDGANDPDAIAIRDKAQAWLLYLKC